MSTFTSLGLNNLELCFFIRTIHAKMISFFFSRQEHPSAFQLFVSDPFRRQLIGLSRLQGTIYDGIAIHHITIFQDPESFNFRNF